MDGWDLLSFGPGGIQFRLNFTNPIEVSGGEEPDLLLVQLDLSNYKSADGQSLPDSLVKYVPIVTQMGSKEEAERVEEQGKTANSSTKSTIIGNILVSVVLGGSLNAVWDMIEGL